MLTFSFILVIISIFVWSNTYEYVYCLHDNGWGINKNDGKKVSFNVYSIILILLLFIPYLNIFLFLIYAFMYTLKLFPVRKYDKSIIYRIKLN